MIFIRCGLEFWNSDVMHCVVFMIGLVGKGAQRPQQTSIVRTQESWKLWLYDAWFAGSVLGVSHSELASRVRQNTADLELNKFRISTRLLVLFRTELKDVEVLVRNLSQLLHFENIWSTDRIGIAKYQQLSNRVTWSKPGSAGEVL